MCVRFLPIVCFLFLPLQVLAFDVGLSNLSLEKDDKLMTKILQSLEKVDSFALDESADASGYSVSELKDIIAGKEVKLSSKNDFNSVSSELDRVKSIVSSQQRFYRLLGDAQTRAQITTWSVDGEEISPVGDLALSMQRLYCAVASEEAVSCGDVSGLRPLYPEQFKGLMAVSDELFFEAKQLFEDAKVGYHKQTNTFDSGTCKDYSKQKLLTDGAFTLSTKASKEVVEHDLQSAQDAYFAEHESTLQSEFSFSAAYDYLKSVEDRYMGELGDNFADDQSVTNDDAVSEKVTGSYSATGDRFTTLATSDELDAHFTKLRAAMDVAESDVKLAFPWRVSAAIKDVFLADKMDELRQVMNGVSSEVSGLADLAEVLSNKQQCQ